ncbi:MAG: shikimate dehydrogenase, partial [Salinisphaera sp.]|nr:shikimate dehydrogenase [Salinisphaera sp.]
HSRSPAIHAAFARQTGEDIAYERLGAEIGRFAETAERFFAQGGRGLNVTLPFKGQAYDFVDQVSERAREVGVVNTILIGPDGRRTGDNSDGCGLLRDLSVNHGLVLAGTRILVLGAGGAAAGVLPPLLRAAPLRLVLANRTVEKAVALAARHAGLGPVRAVDLSELAECAPFDLVINATSAGIEGAAPALPEALFSARAAAYDLFYAEAATPFMEWAGGQGVSRVWDGFGMLVEQAAESFYLWRGVRARTREVIAALRPGEIG